MISKDTIDKIFEATRIEEVIEGFVQLKKSGANFKALSPFTDERTPSFMVSPSKQIWKDFSSGKGGNAITFLMEYEHLSYPEALRYLAQKYNIEIEETQQNTEGKELADKRGSMYLLNKYACAYFHRTLLESEKGKAIGLTYFKERNFSEASIAEFDLGYALDEWESFTTKALADGYNKDLLESLGLTIVKGEKQFDRFKGRIIFPIHSMTGRILGFGGRTLSNEKKTAKYINSPESEIYHKSHILYGIFQAKQAISKEDTCYLVEGYTDVIQMHQVGIKNVVASSGTALTKEQISLIRRLTPNITILYDGDAAGQKASLRGIDMILEEGMNVKVCNFPEGQDPDSFASKNNLEELKTYLTSFTKDFITHKAQLLYSDVEKNDPIKKAEVIRSIVLSISKIPDLIKREVYLKACASVMEVSEKVLFGSMAQIIQNNSSKFKRQQTTPMPLQLSKGGGHLKPTNHQNVLEREIIKLLLLYGHIEIEFKDEILENKDGELNVKPITVSKKVFEKIYTDLQQDEIIFSNSLFKTIYDELVLLYTKEGHVSIREFLKTASSEAIEVITSILMEDEKYKLSDWEKKGVFIKEKSKYASQMTQETILDFRFLMIYKIMEQLQEQIKDPEVDHDKILSEVLNYKMLENTLSRKFNDRRHLKQ